jgi:hypothetical protein
MAIIGLGSSGVRRKRVFLSHSHRDKRFVRSLASALEAEGFHAWVDEAEMHIGDSLVTKLSSAIVNGVDCVVAVISKKSHRSKWVKKELEWASTNEIKGQRVPVLPLLKEKARLPPFLIEKVFADFRNRHGREKALAQLVRSIRALGSALRSRRGGSAGRK